MLEIILKDFTWLAKWIWIRIAQRGMGEASWCYVWLATCSSIMTDVQAGCSRPVLVSRYANIQLNLPMRSHIINLIEDAILAKAMPHADYMQMQAQSVRSEFYRFKFKNNIAPSLARGAV